MTDVRIRRIGPGPALLVEDAERLVAHFIDHDASSQPGGYDDLAGHGARDRITRDDVVAINTTMRARSPHAAWEPLISDPSPLPWLAALDPGWDLIAELDARWDASIHEPVAAALAAATGPGRGISVGTKVLHLKRPKMFPVLDRLVLDQLGVTESVPPMTIVSHLRAEGRRNLPALREIQQAIRPDERSLIRILDILLWASHPASGLTPTLGAWAHRFGPSTSLGARATTRDNRPPVLGTAPPSRTPSRHGGGGEDRSFDEVWQCIRTRGEFRVISSRGTPYVVTADVSKGRRVLLARPRSGVVYVHADCFGDDLTCQGTRAGGIYHGSPSIWDC